MLTREMRDAIERAELFPLATAAGMRVSAVGAAFRPAAPFQLLF